MPLYEYLCKKCGAESEILAGSITESTPACPECSSKRMEKMLSVPCAVLMGHSHSDSPGCDMDPTCCEAGETCSSPLCKK